jgi:uncharacterized protein (TIGR02147 family)
MDFCQNRSRSFLNDEFKERRDKNPSYSLRSYARDAGVNSGVMSQILNGRRSFTRKQAEKIADALRMSDESKRKFIGNVSQIPNEAAGNVKAPFRVLKSDAFHLIADWHHYAILSLLETNSPPKTSPAVAKRLGIDVGTARAAIDRLIRLGLVYRMDGRLVADTEGLRTTEDIPNEAIRESHRQILSKAAHSLEHVEINKRDASYVSFCCDPKDLLKAKKLIREFRRKFTKIMEVGEKREVYAISIHLIPLSREE